jgi:hypothetical protein
MKYTIAITGLPRTGTTSLWRSYGEHPQISRSRRKEPLQIFTENNIDRYIKNNYLLNKNTKVLLDGSTNIITYKTNLIKRVSQLENIERVCCIYTVRDPIERTLSQTNNFLRNYFRGYIQKPIFLNNDYSIDFYHLNTFFCFMLNEVEIIKKLQNLIGLDNILFISIKRLFEDQQRIFSNLGIKDNLSIEIRRLNKTIDLTPTIQQLKILAIIKKWFTKHRKRLENISEENKKMIKDKYLKEAYE